MTSQPVRKASAPRLAAPRRKQRRDRSGSSLAASLISSLGSTPGMILRCAHGGSPQRPAIIARRLFGTSSASATCTAGSRQSRHGEEVHVTGKIVAAEQRGQFLELHRFPDRQTRQHDHDAGKDHAEVEQLLHRVVVATDRRATSLPVSAAMASLSTSDGRIGSSLRRKRPVARPSVT